MSAAATPNPLETVLAWLFHASWQAAVIGLVVVLLAGSLRGWLRPRWRFALWLVVLVRLAVPITPAAPWSLFGLMTPTPEAPPRPVEQPIAAPLPTLPEHVVVSGPVAYHEAKAAVSEPPVAWEQPAPSPEPVREELPPPVEITTASWLAAVWLFGVVILLLRQARLVLQLRRQRRAWREPSDPGLLDLFRRCREEVGVVRPVQLLVAADQFGPATCGALRPRIVLPESLLTRLTPDELRLVLLHEMTHVRRRDVLVDRLAAAVVAVHWFNPVAWLALAGLRRNRELACDEAVLGGLGANESGRYGRALLNVAQCLSNPTPPAAAVGAFGSYQPLVRRIRMIASHRKPTTAANLLGASLLLALVAFGLTDAKEVATVPAPPDDPAPAAKEKDVKPLTIAGVCQDEKGKPIAGVSVALYREDYGARKQTRLKAETTGDDGKFEFRDLPALPSGSDPAWGYAVVVTKAGRGSRVEYVPDRLKKPLRIEMKPAATLKGRVTNADGKPVAGARVWGSWLQTGPVDGALSTRTDADGRYAITDMTAWGPDATQPKPAGEGVMMALAGCYFDVLHPDYGHVRPMYRTMPATVDVVLKPAGVIEGRAIDKVSGKPAAGVMVSMQGTSGDSERGFAQVRTGPDGKYRIPSIVAGKYNLWVETADRTCVALDSFAVAAGKTHAAPDLELIEGGWLEGRLVDAVTKKPIGGTTKDGQLLVALYGPSRPKSGAACQSCPVDDQGRFRLRVAPGVNYPYIMTSDLWARTQRKEFFEKGIEVKAGEVVAVEFRILPTKPIPDPELTPVRLAVPVEAERKAAEKIRELGGWYDVGKDKHVVEVNMVYHETPEKRRLDNRQVDTDGALRVAGEFPRLKRLFLHKGQATDDGLRALTKLTDLEVLMVWDAVQVTDAGIAHLAGLPKLRELHFGNGKLGDGALAVFGRMPAVTSLSLQGNAFTDDGLKHLAGHKHLKSLWVGMNKGPITDAGVKHLAGLTTLEELDLQGSQLTDVGVASLKNLKELRSLMVKGSKAGGATITGASLEHLLGMTRLESLWVLDTRLTEAGVGRLAKLKDLKELYLSSTEIPDEARTRLQQALPGVQVGLTRLAPKR